MAISIADQGLPAKAANKAPISTHPLFPAIVALWFAALLGLGSLILPTILLERLVTVTGLSSLVPQAAPPLGFTARAVLALAASASGAVLGLVVARQVAQNHAPKPKARFVDADSREFRPISAHDELGEEGLGDAMGPVFGQKRRALAIAEDGRRSEFLQHAPLPGEASDARIPLDLPEEALELGDYAEDDDPQSDQDEIMTNGSDFHSPDRTPTTGPERTDRSERQEFAPLGAFANEAGLDEPDEDELGENELGEAIAGDALPFAAPSLRRQQGVPNFMSDSFDMDEDEPVDPYIPSGTFGSPATEASARPFGSPSAPADPALAAQSDRPESPAAPVPPRLAVVAPEPLAAAMAAAVADGRPLDDLGLVQLAARLGASLERRRAQREAASHDTARVQVFAASPEDFDAAAAEDAAAARASFFAPAQPEIAQAAFPQPFQPDLPEADAYAVDEPLLARKPIALKGISFGDDEEEDEDEAYSASFEMPGQPALPDDDFAYGEGEEDYEAEVAAAYGDEAEADDSDYSSLLAMKNPFQKKPEFVRIEDPEFEDEDGFETTVTFPAARQPEPAPVRAFDPPPSVSSAHAAPADPGDAERELRAALATLQRMSGAA
ncbi:hypothetical protein [Tsuneonella sp. HG222]